MTRTLKGIGIIFLVILLAEIILRCIYTQELKTRKIPLIYQPDPLIDYTFIPNSKSQFAGAGFKLKNVNINSKGYSCKEFDVTKKPGTYRIIVSGSSMSGNIFMNGNECYSDKLQKLFDRDGLRVEIINCAIDGTGRQKANLDLIKRDLLLFNPDLILLEFSLPFMSKNMSRTVYKDYLIEYEANSEISRNKGKEIIDYLYDHKHLTFFYDVSYIVRAICRSYIETYGNNDLVKRRLYAYRSKVTRPDVIAAQRAYLCYPINTTMHLLDEVRDSVANKKANLLLFNPWMFLDDAPIKVELKDSLDKYGFKYFFPGIKFKEIHKSLPDSHLNEKGHELIAKALYLELKKYVK